MYGGDQNTTNFISSEQRVGSLDVIHSPLWRVFVSRPAATKTTTTTTTTRRFSASWRAFPSLIWNVGHHARWYVNLVDFYKSFAENGLIQSLECKRIMNANCWKFMCNPLDTNLAINSAGRGKYKNPLFTILGFKSFYKNIQFTLSFVFWVFIIFCSLVCECRTCNYLVFIIPIWISKLVFAMNTLPINILLLVFFSFWSC
jgi:hypothetical protein